MARMYLAFLLLAMATGQIADLAGFIRILESYRVGGEAVATGFGAGLVAGELVGGLWLLGPGRFRERGAIVAVVVAVAWTILAVQAFARGLALENCGCFGVFLAQELRWWVLLQDVVFVGLGLLTWYRVRGGQARWISHRSATAH